jgi:hypothetical protein
VASSISITTDGMLSILATIASPPLVAAIVGVFLPLSIVHAGIGSDQVVRRPIRSATTRRSRDG